MSAFLNQQLTNVGWDALSIALGGGRLTFYKMQAGQGTIANDAAIPPMTSLVTPIVDIPISSYVIEGDGQITLFGNINSSELTTGFTFRELGVFATIEDPVAGKGGIPSGPNISAITAPSTTANPVVPTPTPGTALMYSYCNSYASSDYIPGSGESTDVVNTVQVTIKIDQAEDVQINILAGQQMSVVNIGPASVGAGPWSYTTANVAYLKRIVEGPGLQVVEDTNTITVGLRQLTADLDLYVANGNPDISPHFSTIQKAIDYLGQYLIPTPIQARIHVSRGEYILSKAQFLNHPNSQSITIQGPQNARINGTSILSITGSAYNWSVRFGGFASTAPLAVNDWVIIDSANSNNGTQSLVSGFFKVTAVTASSVTVLVPWSGASMSVTGVTGVSMIPITAMLIPPPNDAAMNIGSYGVGLFQYFGIRQPVTPTIYAVGLQITGSSTIKFVGATGYNAINNAQGTLINHGIITAYIDASLVSCAVTNCQNGIVSAGGASVNATTCVVSHCSTYAYWNETNATLAFAGGWSTAGGCGLEALHCGNGSTLIVANSTPAGAILCERCGYGAVLINKAALTIVGQGILHSHYHTSSYDAYVANFGLLSGSSRLLGSRIFNAPVGTITATGGLIN